MQRLLIRRAVAALGVSPSLVDSLSAARSLATPRRRDGRGSRLGRTPPMVPASPGLTTSDPSACRRPSSLRSLPARGARWSISPGTTAAGRQPRVTRPTWRATAGGPSAAQQPCVAGVTWHPSGASGGDAPVQRLRPEGRCSATACGSRIRPADLGPRGHPTRLASVGSGPARRTPREYLRSYLFW